MYRSFGFELHSLQSLHRGNAAILAQYVIPVLAGWRSVNLHLAPGVHIAGGVTIDESAFLGTGAGAIPNVHIGADSVIGAGGVVVDDIPSRVTVVGVPARLSNGATNFHKGR